MNKSSNFSRLLLGTAGVACCIVGIHTLLGIGNPSSLQEEPVPSQIQPQLEELLEDLPLEDLQNVRDALGDIGNLSS
tara:strand:+ start:7582 stop:7812 length:231 start_codon:yes stop_codon:yes gene_type:complete